MAELKTKPNNANVDAFLNSVEDDRKREDLYQVMELMKQITNEKPKMWGASMVGFGSYHYKYASGREGDWFVCGFTPRKRELTIYVMAGISRYEDLMAKLGKHKTGKSCLYIKKLDDIDINILRELVALSVEHVTKFGASQ